jgi:hypothetical protein
MVELFYFTPYKGVKNSSWAKISHPPDVCILVFWPGNIYWGIDERQIIIHAAAGVFTVGY